MLYRDSGDAWGIGRYPPVLAGAAFGQAKPERAARLFAAAALWDHLGIPLPPTIQRDYTRAVAAVHRVLGDDAFSTAWFKGVETPMDEAVDYALAGDAPV